LAAIGTLMMLTMSHTRPDARSESRKEVIVGGRGGIPLVEPEPGPIKVKPKDPGGLDVPHKDITVYERLEGPARKAAPAGEARHAAKQPHGPKAKSKDKKVAQAVGPYRVQLGSFTSAQTAERRWRELRQRYPHVIGSLQMMVERVRIRSKGVFYRLQAGPLKSPEDVHRICAALAQHKVGCFLVKS
jgi:cell division protein FtsN